MRMIDADYLKEHLTTCSINGMPLHRMYTELDELLEAIDDVPTIEPEHDTAYWIKPTGMMPPEHHGHYECSNCGQWAMRPWLKPWKGVVISDFCPRCGRKMLKDGEG